MGIGKELDPDYTKRLQMSKKALFGDPLCMSTDTWIIEMLCANRAVPNTGHLMFGCRAAWD